MFKKRNMYLISFISLAEMLAAMFLVKPSLEVLAAFFICWSVFIAWNLWSLFNVDDSTISFGHFVPKGINTERKFAVLITSAFGLVILPGVVLWSWLAH
jgi:hypothetical protein